MKIIFAALLVICGGNLIASPIDGLASPSQETRDAAAKIIRATYIPPSRTNWDALLAQIKVGDTMTNVWKQIHQYNPKAEPGAYWAGGIGRISGFQDYRLDDLWSARCSFVEDDSGGRKLTEKALVQSMREIRLVPPSNFTGTWTLYFANGQKSDDIEYRDGKYVTWVIYYPTGAKREFQHYNETNVTCTIYNEDGTTNHVTNIP